MMSRLWQSVVVTCLCSVGLCASLPQAPERAMVALRDLGAELRAFERQPVSWWPHVVNAAWGGGRGGPERRGGWLDENWELVDTIDRSADYSTHGYLTHRGIWFEVYGSNEYQETIHFHETGARKLLWDNGVARDMLGERVLSQHYNTQVKWWKDKVGWDAFIVCSNAPRWWAILNYDWLTSPLLGHAMSQDNIGGPTSRIGAGGHGRYCDHCNARFHHYLATTNRLPDFRRQHTHIRDYLRANLMDVVRQLPPHVKHRWDAKEASLLARLCEPPVMSEYQKFRTLSHLHNFIRFYKDAKLLAARVGREYDVHGNQGGGFIGPNPYQVALADFVDTVWFESSGLSSYDVFKYGWNNAWGAFRYTMGQAMTRGERPFMSMTRFHKHTPDIVEHEMAEACAGGGVLFVNQQHFEKEPDLQAKLTEYFRFRHAHRALFANPGKRPYAQVALAYSIPTFLFRSYQYAGESPPNTDLSGMARALFEGHIPFDVVILNHPEIHPDPVTLDGLKRYKLVILPSLECLTDAQIDLFTRYLRAGGTLGLIGQSGIRTEDNLPRKQPPLDTWRDAGQVVELLPGRHFLNVRIKESEETRELTRTAIAAVRKALGGKTILDGDLPRMLWAWAWQHEGGFVSFHFVNYAINFESGKATPTPPMKVRLRLPEAVPFEDAAWLTPDGSRQPVTMMVDDATVTVALPPVRVYGVLVMGRRGLDATRSALLHAEALAARAAMAAGPGDASIESLRAILGAFRAQSARQPLEPDNAGVLIQSVRAILHRVQREQDAAYQARVRQAADAEGAVLALDFGAKETSKPWRAVAADSGYSPDAGFGWLPPADDSEPTPEELYYAMAARYGGKIATEVKASRLLFWPYKERPPVALRTNLACGTPRRFRIDLPPGHYTVRVVTTMPSWTNRNFLVSGMVRANGAVRLLDAPHDKGSLVARQFPVSMQHGKLELTFGGPTGWGVAALVIKRGEAAQPDRLAAGGLRAWRISPRYANPDWAPITQTTCPPEKRLATLPDPGWTELKAPPRGLPVVDLGSNRQAEVGDIVYAATTIEAPAARTATLSFGASSQAQVWLNGEPVGYVPNEKGVRRDELVVPLPLRQGRNTLVVKLQRFWERRWLFYASVTGSR